MAKKTAYLKNGGPGCGKGTDAGVVARERGIKQFEMGPHLLDLRKRDVTLDRVMKDTTDIGLYVPDNHLLPILEGQLHNGLPDEFVADGITRTDGQARMVLRILRSRGYRVVTINYYVPEGDDTVFYTRMTGRKRPGETPEVQHRRVVEYRKHNPAVLGVFESWPHHFLRSIDGRLEHEHRLHHIRTIIADAPGARTLHAGLATYQPPPGMVCSGH